MNNYWDTNYVAGQGGDFTFRYVFTSGREFQPGSLSRLGWEEMSPLEADLVTHLDKAVDAPRPLDPANGSFLQVDSPHVVLVTWKRAEDEHGTILRLVEVGGQTGTVNITAPLLNVKSAWLCNALEKNQQPLRASGHTLSFPIQPFQIITIRVEGATAVRQP
jgi:alpha-mannosidase